MSGSPESLPRRAKRQKYAPNACNECRRRKAKCDGRPSCERCRSFQIECVYPTIKESPRAGSQESELLLQLHNKMDFLQSQVGQILRNVQSPSVDLSAESSLSQPGFLEENVGSTHIQSDVSLSKEPAYVGPTSFIFGLDRRKPDRRQVRPDQDNYEPESNENPTKLSRDHAFRMIDLFEETVGDEYPCFDLNLVRQCAGKLFDEPQESVEGRLFQIPSPLSPFNRDFEILRAILANGLVLDGDGRNTSAAIMMDRIETVMYNRIKVFEVDTKELLLLLLMSLYYFHCGEDVMAYRHTGLAARGLLEMGLHRRSTWAHRSSNFPGDLEFIWTMRLFWCIYCLDRRWSLSTGLPFAIQDADIDVDLPEIDETTPYLRCMVEYSQLTSKVWRMVTDTENRITRESDETALYLDYQIQQWLNLTPTSLKLKGTLEREIASLPETQVMLKMLLHLRASQLRIILRKPELLSREKIAQNKGAVDVTVDLARDMVQRIYSLHRTTGIYRKHRTAFDSFLVSAVAVFCLVTCYAADIFYTKVKGDFCVALEIAKDFLTTSVSARRLWKTIRQIRRISPHLELISETSSHSGEGSSVLRAPKDSTSRFAESEWQSVRPVAGQRGVAKLQPSGWFDALNVWPADASQVSQELDHIFQAFNHPHVDPASSEDADFRERSEWGQSTSANNPEVTDTGENNAEIFRLFTELF